MKIFPSYEEIESPLGIKTDNGNSADFERLTGVTTVDESNPAPPDADY